MKDESILSLLQCADYSAITQQAINNRRVLSELIALTLNENELIGWRAVKALGLASAIVAERDAEFVRGILRRLMWLMNDESGSIGWRAPQAMGAIIAQRPATFAAFITIVVTMFDVEEKHFYPGILWAIGHIAEHDAERVRYALPVVLGFVNDASPQTRGLAVWCAGTMRDARAIGALQNCVDDDARVCVFENDALVARTVGELARVALQIS